MENMNNEKNKRNVTKNKKVKIALILSTLAIIVIAIVMFMTGNKHIILKDSKNLPTVVEYGQNISLKLEDYLDTSKIDKNDLSKMTITCKEATNESDERKFPKIGKYKIVVTYARDKETKEINVEVKDTTKPVFNKDSKKEINTYKDVKLENINEFIKVDDLSKTTITVDESKIDYSKEGSYIAKVTVKDESNNETSMDLKVNVKNPEISLDNSKKSVYVKESFVLKPSIKGKNNKATFKSSDPSVATVSESGKVVAKKAGTTTIIAEANGVKAECKVTVKKLPTNSQTTTQTVVNPTTGQKEEVVVVKPKPKPTPSGASISSEALNIVNSERAKRGLPVLQYKSILGQAAKIRAKEASQKFSHTRPNGEACLSVLWDLNYPGLHGSREWTEGSQECLGSGFGSAQSVVNGWKDSRGHWNSLMHPEHKYAAIARCGNTWCAVLIKY